MIRGRETGRRPLAAIVRYESRRRYRVVIADDQRLLQYVIFGLFGSVGVLALVGVAFWAGRTAAEGDGAGLFAPVGAAVVVALAVVSGYEAWHSGRTGLLPASPESVLLGADHRTVLLGVLAVECLRNLAVVGVSGLLAGLAFGLGAGSPASVGSIALTAGATVILGTLLGVAVALAVRNAVAHVELIARLRVPIAAAAFFAYMLLWVTDLFSVVVGSLIAVVPVETVAWFAHLPLLAAVPTAEPVVAVLVLAGALTGSLALVSVTGWLAGRLWYETPVRPGGRSYESSMAGVPGLGRQTGAVVRRAWIRARRSPARLLGYVWPAVFFVQPVLSAFRTGVVPAWLPLAVGLYGVWATGALFTLNPIGDETPMLPVTLTTPLSGRRHVRALWLAGGVVGVSLTLAATAAAGVLASYAPVDVVLVALLAAGLAALAPALAAGIGAAYPETETTAVLGQVETTQPGFVPFLGYSLGIAVLSAPAWAVPPLVIREWLAAWTGVPGLVFGVGAGAVALALVGFVARYSVRRAAVSFDTYTVA